ncbi:hypothetical protein GWI33_017279 [Rhynchophorus ferrugineus]|uniref:Uncharacterized protein n=1 Tax=Rhynchophorus ferrugineus TaxID=354439 RepID=A0A834I2C0_RHYFE|nr:hypothetical protein GWI33_017279 [Rhynchophorus ferrugineus]
MISSVPNELVRHDGTQMAKKQMQVVPDDERYSPFTSLFAALFPTARKTDEKHDVSGRNLRKMKKTTASGRQQVTRSAERKLKTNAKRYHETARPKKKNRRRAAPAFADSTSIVCETLGMAKVTGTREEGLRSKERKRTVTGATIIRC